MAELNESKPAPAVSKEQKDLENNTPSTADPQGE